MRITCQLLEVSASKSWFLYSRIASINGMEPASLLRFFVNQSLVKVGAFANKPNFTHLAVSLPLLVCLQRRTKSGVILATGPNSFFVFVPFEIVFVDGLYRVDMPGVICFPFPSWPPSPAPSIRPALREQYREQRLQLIFAFAVLPCGDGVEPTS